MASKNDSNKTYFHGYYNLIDIETNFKVFKKPFELSSTVHRKILVIQNPGIGGCVSNDYNTILLLISNKNAPLIFYYVTYPITNTYDVIANLLKYVSQPV